MTKPLAPRAVLAGRAAVDARERLAATLYDPATVLEAIAAAAAAGFCQHVIKPAQPFDLQNTAAAVRLVELLLAEKFSATWVTIESPLGPIEAPYFALLIKWPLPGGHKTSSKSASG